MRIHLELSSNFQYNFSRHRENPDCLSDMDQKVCSNFHGFQFRIRLLRLVKSVWLGLTENENNMIKSNSNNIIRK